MLRASIEEASGTQTSRSETRIDSSLRTCHRGEMPPIRGAGIVRSDVPVESNKLDSSSMPKQGASKSNSAHGTTCRGRKTRLHCPHTSRLEALGKEAVVQFVGRKKPTHKADAPFD